MSTAKQDQRYGDQSYRRREVKESRTREKESANWGREADREGKEGSEWSSREEREQNGNNERYGEVKSEEVRDLGGGRVKSEYQSIGQNGSQEIES